MKMVEANLVLYVHRYGFEPPQITEQTIDWAGHYFKVGISSSNQEASMASFINTFCMSRRIALPVGRLKKDMIISETTLFVYCRQTVGVPYPSGKDIGAARKLINELWVNYPHTYGDYKLLANIADWASARKKKYATITGLLGSWRYAYQDGYLPQLDSAVSDKDAMKEELEDILGLEDDDYWRRRLQWAYGQGVDIFRDIMLEWEDTRLGKLWDEVKEQRGETRRDIPGRF